MEINVRVEDGKFDNDTKKFIPKRKVIEVSFYDEIQQECYQFCAMDTPNQLKQVILEAVSEKIDEIIMNDNPSGSDDNWLLNKLNRIKIIDICDEGLEVK